MSSRLESEIDKLIIDHNYPRELLDRGASDINTMKNVENACKSISMLVEHITTHINKEEKTVFPKIEKSTLKDDYEKIYKEF